MDCPKCGFRQQEGAEECVRCGLVFRKWEQGAGLARPSPAPAGFVGADTVEEAGPGRKEWLLLAAGASAALAVYAVPFLRFVLSALVTLFHEFGHAAAAWLLGHPAVPAFDIVYGGGFTHHQGFRLSLALVVGAAWIGLGWVFRQRSRVLIAVVAGALLWLLAVSAAWRREVVIAASGHVGEIVLAAAFLLMALANVGWRRPEVERPLGLFVAFFVQIHTMHFAWRIQNVPEFRAWYLEGKGGALMNDLETIALDLHIHTGLPPDVPALAGWLLAFSFLPLAAGLAWWWRRQLAQQRRSEAGTVSAASSSGRLPSRQSRPAS